ATWLHARTPFASGEHGASEDVPAPGGRHLGADQCARGPSKPSPTQRCAGSPWSKGWQRLIFAKMKALVLLAALGGLTTSGIAQQIDTLRFHSNAFGAQRMVVVHLPEFHRYASEEVRMPVII